MWNQEFDIGIRDLIYTTFRTFNLSPMAQSVVLQTLEQVVAGSILGLANILSED